MDGVSADPNNAQLYQQTQLATTTPYDRAGNIVPVADAETARFREIVRQIEELQTEFDEIRRIGEIVKAYHALVGARDGRIRDSSGTISAETPLSSLQNVSSSTQNSKTTKLFNENSRLSLASSPGIIILLNYCVVLTHR